MLPVWLKKKNVSGAGVHEMKKRLRQAGLHTVCEEAMCPNLGECFSRGTATFMILGDVCTRRCGFCAVKNGVPNFPDPQEPARVASEAARLKLKHVVVTSVTRDDLPDGGAAHFATTICEIRKVLPDAIIEVLIPDFGGDERAIRTVLEARPDIFNHNLETVERLTPRVRNKADYQRSLGVLKFAQNFSVSIKSGLMLGLGETKEEVVKTMQDLKDVGCEILTIGQYLRPTAASLPVAEYIKPERFEEYQRLGTEIGIKHVFSRPFIRSSYIKL